MEDDETCPPTPKWSGAGRQLLAEGVDVVEASLPRPAPPPPPPGCLVRGTLCFIVGVFDFPVILIPVSCCYRTPGGLNRATAAAAAAAAAAPATGLSPKCESNGVVVVVFEPSNSIRGLRIAACVRDDEHERGETNSCRAVRDHLC